VKAVATVAAPFDVAHVKHLFGDNLTRLEAEGAALAFRSRPIKDYCSAQAPVAALASSHGTQRCRYL